MSEGVTLPPTMDPIPLEVRAAFELDDAPADPVSVGWINRTFVAKRHDERVIVQRLHPIFRGEVNLDIDVITRHLEARGLTTPRVVRTRDDAAWMESDGVWRALTFVEGLTLSALTPDHARAAAELVARFHRALSDLDHTFHFTRPGAHDTPAHLTKLDRLLRDNPDHEVAPVAAAILRHGASLPDLRALRTRIIHGDLKATNVLFTGDERAAVALVDLDTLAHGTIAVELGDALRSWCNPTDESDPEARFDEATFASAMEGYAAGARRLLDPAEIDAIVPGVETIAVELASRFAADAIEDRYFGFDATRFATRVAHNLARARAQLSLATSVASQRDRLASIVRRAFA